MSTSEIQPVASRPLADPGPHYEVELIRDVRIPTGDDGITLSADLYLPISASIVPALVTVLPYRKDGYAGVGNAAKMRWFAARGYASVLVDFRGTGSSDGDQRPPFDPGEAADGVAAVEWAAAQSWCNGNVGIWGISYGAIMAMRTASQRPPHLKAIVAAMGALDLEHDFVHPSGNRGCLASLACWGSQTLLNQLMPPLEGYGTADQQRRWHHRLHEAEPWLVDLFRNGPGHPAWRSRVIAESEITVPTFCVAGWRDLFCDSTIRAYENITAPKKLLAGPWMHTSPEISPFDPVYYPSLVLPWWDHWLNGAENGIMDEPEVTLFEQGSSPRWRQFASWPPADRQLRLGAADDLTLRPLVNGASTNGVNGQDPVIGEYKSDPTVGALSGLWGVPTTGYGLPLDQHDDDARSLTVTGDPFQEDHVIAGRPVVTVGTAPASTFDRLVVRLTDVDPFGRSTLISLGIASSPDSAGRYEVTLAPTCYRVPVGHRLRLALSDADFPRLWSSISDDGHPRILAITGVRMSLPAVSDAQGRSVILPKPNPVDPDLAALTIYARPQWTIQRDLINDGVEVRMGYETAIHTLEREHTVELSTDMGVTARRASPEAARVHGVSTATTRMRTGETVVTQVELHMTQASMTAVGRIEVDGATTFVRNWSM